MWENIKWLRLTPDRPGRGGVKTGIHTFQQQPVNDTRTLQSAHVYNGYWRRDVDSIAYPNPQTLNPGDVSSYAVHGYVYPSLTDPAALPNVTVLSHQVGAVHNGTNAHVWDFTHGTYRADRPGTNQRGVFNTVNQRCFFGDGTAEGYIFDDRTPAIHAQPNQPIGVEAPQQALTPLGGTGVVPDGTCYAYNGGGFLAHPNPDNLLGTIKAGETITLSKLDPNYVAIYAGALPVAFAAPLDAETSNTTAFSAAGTISIDPAVDPSLVTLSDATWPATFGYCGMSINFNGYSFVILSHGPTNTLDLNGNAKALSNVQLLILGVYTGPKLTNVAYTITGCRVSLAAANSLNVVNSNSLLTPPGGAFGYSQSTAADLVQIRINCVRTSGSYRNLGGVSLGPVGGGTPSTVTDGQINIGANRLGSSTGPWVSDDVGKTIVVDEASITNGMLITTIQVFFGSSAIQIATTNSSGNNLTSQRCWWGTGFISCGDATMGGGSNTVTAASNPWTVNDVGKTIMIDKAGPATGFGGANIALYTTIVAFVSPGQITVGTVSTAAVANVSAIWGAGTSNTHTGPTYAYAWYDPETGHCSNISPLTTIPKPTTLGNYPDFANITPCFQIDPGFLSYPNQTTDGIRFSHIMFFRTLSTPGSSTLYPIGSLMPYVGKVHPGAASTRGSWNPSTFHGWMGLPNNYVNAPPVTPNTGPINVWYDFSSDSDLLLSGGFRAPQFTNGKPMALIRGGITQPGKPYALAYWDRRTWLVNTQEPDKILFSCDEAQCPLGVPEESFPPTNFLRLPAVDGRVIGMRTIGEMLLITTQRWAYIVAGNNESNYRLMKISSSMPGVGHYQMDEFPTLSGAEGEPVTMFFLGRDRKVYQWTVGAQTVPISQPIQDQLDTLLGPSSSPLAYPWSTVHCVSAWGRRLVVVGIYYGNPATIFGLKTFIYDVDHQIWSVSFREDGTGGLGLWAGLAPMTTVYGSDPPINEIYTIFSVNANNVICRSWLRDDVNVSSVPLNMETFPINFDGKKTRKQIVSVNLHATTGGTYTGFVRVNEGGALAMTFGPYTDPLDSIYATGASPVDQNAEDIVVLAGSFGPDGTPVVGYRFIIQVFRGDNVPGKIYAIDIGYIDVENPAEGDG